jgi:hypothetical protein
MFLCVIVNLCTTVVDIGPTWTKSNLTNLKQTYTGRLLTRKHAGIIRPEGSTGWNPFPQIALHFKMVPKTFRIKDTECIIHQNCELPYHGQVGLNLMECKDFSTFNPTYSSCRWSWVCFLPPEFRKLQFISHYNYQHSLYVQLRPMQKPD